jgi:hypothetical protein
MRTRRRAAFILASVAAFGVSLIAYAGSAGAEVVVPACTPAATTGNDSCLTLRATPQNAPASFTGGQMLGVRTHTNYVAAGNTAQGGKAKTVTLFFDNDFQINVAAGGANNCLSSDVANKTVAQAYAACGPAGKNTYLSTQVPGAPTLSGKASTAPASNFGACTMVFKGPTASQVLLYARVFTTTNSNPACDSISNPGGTTPASQGQVAITLTGTIANAGVAGFGKKLTVPGIDSLTLPLDDFYASLKRGTYFQARCPAGTTPWRLRGIFAYSGTQPNQGGPADTVNTSYPCT